MPSRCLPKKLLCALPIASLARARAAFLYREIRLRVARSGTVRLFLPFSAHIISTRHITITEMLLEICKDTTRQQEGGGN